LQRNLIHEVGIWGKQTSAYVQAITCRTILVGNILFNGPRAGINFNDGFGGGNQLFKNLAFNWVRETGDHGPFNSWDRQPFLTRVADGVTPSLIPAFSQIYRNFLLNNYNSVWPLDHDDGSCYFNDTFNFMVYGGFKNYLGHSKLATHNVYVYPAGGSPYCMYSEGQAAGVSGWGEQWQYNVCIKDDDDVYDLGNCAANDPALTVPLTLSNQFHTPNATIALDCSGAKLTLQQWQSAGMDIGSTFGAPLSADEIIALGRAVLEM